MANINQKELEAINKFYGSFLSSNVDFLTKNLDVEIGLTMEYQKEAPSIKDFKGSHVVCSLNGLEGYIGYSIIVVPEELIASISDIIMGGSGTNVYKGNLSELEINASAGMIENFFENVRESFQESFVKELVFSSVPKFVEKNTKGYDESFDGGNFDVSVGFTLSINKDQKFETFLLANSNELITSLQNIGLLEIEKVPEEVMPTQISLTQQPSTKMGTYDIRKISDVKIDITAELGKANVPIKQILSLIKGSILELDTEENEDIAVFANGSEVAKAQIVVVDGYFGIKITKILNPKERFKRI